MYSGLWKNKHEKGGEKDHASLNIVTDKHDLRFVPAIPEYTAERRQNEKNRAAERQVKTLQESVGIADLQNVKAYGKTVQDCTELRYQGAEKYQPEVPAGKDIFAGGGCIFIHVR